MSYAEKENANSLSWTVMSLVNCQTDLDSMTDREEKHKQREGGITDTPSLGWVHSNERVLKELHHA